VPRIPAYPGEAKLVPQLRLMNRIESTVLLGLRRFMVQFIGGLNRKLPESGLLAKMARTILQSQKPEMGEGQ
jgi:hypothetical protein